MPSINDLMAKTVARLAINGIMAGELVPSAGSPTSLPPAYCRKVVVQAHPDNSDKINVGDADSQPLVLSAGDRIELEVNDSSSVYVKSNSASDKVTYIFITAG